MADLKKPLTYEEQLVRLREGHGLMIENEAEAIDILARVNYYRLSAYGIGLKNRENPEKYQDGISLVYLYRLYSFDCHLRNALLQIIEHVEIELRTQIAYHISLAYGAEGYRDPNNFEDRTDKKGNSIHQKTLMKFDTEVANQNHLPCVKHHLQKYDGRFPFWAAVELFSFGMLSSMYSIMRMDDRKKVACFYDVDPAYLGKWIHFLADVRNRCAHYGRIYNMPLSSTPRLFNESQAYSSNRIFSAFLILKRLMQGKPSWNTFLATLVGLIEEYPEANLAFMGFPKNWTQVLTSAGQYPK